MKVMFLGLIGLSAISGCAVGPDYHAPNPAMPRQWRETAADLPMTAYQSQWWRSFNDAELNWLINEAVAVNLDVKQAAARIRDARAQQTIAVAGALPSVIANSSLSRRSNNLSSIGGAGGAGGLANGGAGAFGVGGQVINILQAGFDAQWELDLFGGIRRGIEAAEANTDATIEDRHAVLVSLQGELARLYIQLRANQQLLAITRQDLASQRETLELTKIRNRAGLISALDVSQQEALAAETEARLPGYQSAINQSVHAIGFLLGKHPNALAPRLEREGVIPASTAVMTDLPSELLRRRPDIRRSERQVAAANAEIGVAVAELYPKFNLASFLGIQNTQISDFTPVGKSWSAVASISMPVFNWGKLQANINSKKAQKESYQLAYEATVLTALKEVEDALSDCVQEKQRQQSLQAEVSANELSLHLSEERYRRGLTAFLDVLDSQRNLLQAKSNFVQSQAQQSQNVVALYKALGGGWEKY